MLTEDIKFIFKSGKVILKVVDFAFANVMLREQHNMPLYHAPLAFFTCWQASCRANTCPHMFDFSRKQNNNNKVHAYFR